MKVTIAEALQRADDIKNSNQVTHTETCVVVLADGLIVALAELYLFAPLAVANACDRELDPSGRLLGNVRDESLMR